jgi:uncharacterized protein (DUF2267 family)
MERRLRPDAVPGAQLAPSRDWLSIVASNVRRAIGAFGPAGAGEAVVYWLGDVPVLGRRPARVGAAGRERPMRSTHPEKAASDGETLRDQDPMEPRTRRRLLRIGLRVAVGTAIVLIARKAFVNREQGRRSARRLLRRLDRKFRYACGRAAGIRYRLSGRGPDPDVSDPVLAQRIRSVLGPLERRLDVPRVHVTVTDRETTLHGMVGSASDITAIEDRVLAVPGVTGIHSYLRVERDDEHTRPSAGRAHRPPSAARRDLLGCVRATGVEGEDEVERVLRATLANFLALLPDGERAHVEAHLPADVRELAVAPRHVGTVDKPRTVRALIYEVGESCGCTPRTASDAVNAVIATLRDLVPEEASDVETVLPGELKELWSGRAQAVAP